MSDTTQLPLSETPAITVDLKANNAPYKWSVQEKKASTRKVGGKTVEVPGYRYLWPVNKDAAGWAGFITAHILEAERAKAGQGVALAESFVKRRIMSANEAAINKDGNIDETKIVPEFCNPHPKSGALTIGELFKKREEYVLTNEVFFPLSELNPADPTTMVRIAEATGFKTRDQFVAAVIANRAKMSELTKLIQVQKNKLAEAATKRAQTLAAKTAGA